MIDLSVIPEFKFAVTDEIEKLCPYDGGLLAPEPKDIIKAEDFVPVQHLPTDTGWDVRCAEPNGIRIDPFSYFKMKLGIRMFCPTGWWMKLVPRSSTFVKCHIHGHNGTIDQTFTGQLHFCGQYIPDKREIIPSNSNLYIKFGERVGQLIPTPRFDMIATKISNQELDKLYKDRGELRGGFGSSGRI